MSALKAADLYGTHQKNTDIYPFKFYKIRQAAYQKLFLRIYIGYKVTYSKLLLASTLRSCSPSANFRCSNDAKSTAIT